MLTRATISSEDLILRGNNCEDILTECKLPTYFVSRSSVHYNVQIMKGNQVCMARKKEIFALLESNMKDYYKRANITGWNQKKEWRESFHCNSTFIILSDESSILHGFVQFDVYYMQLRVLLLINVFYSFHGMMLMHQSCLYSIVFNYKHMMMPRVLDSVHFF